MKKLVLVLGVLIALSACTGLSKEEKEKQIQDSIARVDSIKKADSIVNAQIELKKADSLRVADSIAKSQTKTPCKK